MNVYIGIDPGMSGALACITEDGRVNTIRSGQRSADKKRFRGWGFFELPQQGVVFVLIEDINAIPTFGAQTSFLMGRSLGWVDCWADVQQHPVDFVVDYVRPNKWKAEFGLNLKKGSTTKEKKQAALEKATALFPNVPIKDHNQADALLIAEYCRRLHARGK